MGKPAAAPTQFLSYKAWRDGALRQWRKTNPAAGERVAGPTGGRVVFAGTTKAVSAVSDAAQQRRLRWIISTGDIDRYNDVIDPDGWEWAHWQASGAPVFYNHFSWDLPVAQGVDIGVEAGALVSTADFGEAGEDEFVDRLYRRCASGKIKGASVGFLPLEWSYDEERGGFNIIRAELIEWSVTPIPANPAAVQLALRAFAGGAKAERAARRRTHRDPAEPAKGKCVSAFDLTPAIVKAATTAAIGAAVAAAVAKATGRLEE